ncbi:MAG TPA: TlpA disulfide reductase family protein [Terriglobia bacterium]|nr:TlpA disulfide reductase family protein [Terriglobia bacterium]
MKRTIILAVADILTGLAALLLFVLADNYFHVGADLRVAVSVLAVLYLGAGLARGAVRPENACLKGLLVSSGASVVLLILGLNSINPAVLAMLLLILNGFTVCGVRVRHLWAAHSAAGASATAVVSLAALVVLAAAVIPALTTRVATRKMSAPAPAFSISGLDGTEISSSAFRGRVVVLDFWATWCLPCRRELPELEKVYQRYEGNSNVSFWAVDVQKNGETPEKARDFMKKAGYTLPVACGSEKSLAGLGVEAFPSLVIIDRAGRIRLVHTGYDGSEHFQAELSKDIDALLDERP